MYLQELKAKHEKEILALIYSDKLSAKFKTFKSYITHKPDFITFECSTKEDVKDLLNRIKPNILSFKKEHGGNKYLIDRPYEISISNDFYGSKSKIWFSKRNKNIWIEFPTSLISDFVSPYNRTPSDSEHHYYTGYTIAMIRRCSIRSYSFNGKQLDWYGGSKTLIDINLIDSIIKYFNA